MNNVYLLNIESLAAIEGSNDVEHCSSFDTKGPKYVYSSVVASALVREFCWWRFQDHFLLSLAFLHAV